MIDSVTTTNFASTKQGVERLIARGHRRIAYLGHPRRGSGAKERWAGFLSALSAAGLQSDPGLIRHDLVTEADATHAADLVLTTAEPDAVFVDNNRLCMGLLQSRAFADRRPEVLGFDNFALAAQFGISVIDSDPFEVGRAGAQLLFERLAHPGRPPQQIEISARLIVHESSIY
jgi:LacI family transcriptional regulator